MLRKGRPGLSRRGETLEFTATATADPGKVVIGVGKIRRSLMRRIVLAALVLLNCAAFGTELFAQANQTVNPVPITPPTLNTTTTTCQTTCDTQAMLCLNTCVSTAAAPTTTTLAAPSSAGACNLSCTTQQLVCKQRC